MVVSVLYIILHLLAMRMLCVPGVVSFLVVFSLEGMPTTDSRVANEQP